MIKFTEQEMSCIMDELMFFQLTFSRLLSERQGQNKGLFLEIASARDAMLQPFRWIEVRVLGTWMSAWCTWVNSDGTVQARLSDDAPVRTWSEWR